jgi:hypothetical protein
MSDNLLFLQELFPLLDRNEMEKLLLSNELEKVVDMLLERDYSEMQDLIDLSLMFPNHEESLLQDKLMEKGSVDKVVRDIEPSKILVPKAQRVETEYFYNNESAINSLQSMFPTFDIETIQTTMKRSKNDIDKAASMLAENLEILSLNHREKQNENIKTILEILPDTSHELIIEATNKFRTVEDSISYIIQFEEKSRETPWKKTLVGENDQKLVFEDKEIKKNDLKFVFEDKDTKRSENVLDLSTKIISNSNPTKIRQEAFDLLKKRNEIYREAARYYNQGKLTGNSAASYYSQKVT